MQLVECTVADVASQQRNAVVGGPFGSNLGKKDYTATGVPVVRGQNLGLGRWVGGPFVYVSDEKADSLSANLAAPGDLVFTQRGNAVLNGGQVAMVPENGFERYLVSQSQMKLTVDRRKADPTYLYYVFKSADHRAYLRNNAIVTGVPHTNLRLLKQYPLSLPPLHYQQAVASVAKALDDKIELNRQMNETLEATARAVFKSWFVDFDPVRAKLDGRQPHGMNAETAALFPDRFEHVDGELVPAGWKRGTLGDAISIYDSKRVPLSRKEREARRGPYPYHGAAGVLDHVDDYLFDGRYLLIGEDGSVTDKSGYPVLQYVDGQFWVSNHAHVVLGAHAVSTERVLLSLSSTVIVPFVTGAVQPKLNQRNLKSVPFLHTTPEVELAFNEFATPLFDLIVQNRRESQTLAELRDALLPKLLSGELSVPAAEELVEEVA